jgi:hypothetical protein
MAQLDRFTLVGPDKRWAQAIASEARAGFSRRSNRTSPAKTARPVIARRVLLGAVNRAGQAFLLTQWRQKLFR